MKKLIDAIFPLLVLALVALVLVSTGIVARLVWRLICLGWGMA